MDVRSLKTTRMISALALIFLVLFGGLAQSIHDSQFSHRICPEDGELIHVSLSHAPAHAQRHGNSEVPSVDPTDQTTEHEECLVATLLGSCGSPWTSSPATHLVPTGAFLVRAYALARPAAAISPLSFAPKHSPPARAA